MSSGLILTARISERKKVSPQKAHSQSMDRTRSGSLLMIQGLLDIYQAFMFACAFCQRMNRKCVRKTNADR